jgi:quercetin dioxygenase-like cupin family protein
VGPPGSIFFLLGYSFYAPSSITFSITGKAEITLSGQAFLLAEGDFLVLPANQPHALKAIERFKMVLTMIRS